MQNPADAQAAERLRRLEHYLAQDPANPYLLADACDAAMVAGDAQAVERCIVQAQRLRFDPVAWTYRRALAALLAGDAEACRGLAEPLLDATAEPEMVGQIQALWLRASHHQGALASAWQWALQQRQQGRLQPIAAGVASLLAVDLDRLPDARILSDLSLRSADPPAEAQVARAYVALAEDDTALAAQLLEQAHARNPLDGRTLSALGLASLRAGALPQARERFEEATRRVPGHIGTWHALGWTCLLQQDLAAAHAAFAQALQRDRNFGENHAALALSLTLQGRDEEATAHLERAERLDRTGATAGYVRALRSGELRDPEAVRAYASRVVRDAQAWRNDPPQGLRPAKK